MQILPAEINERIIDYLPDLATLYAFLYASPVHNAIFQRCAQKKHHTLRKLLLRALDISLVPLAILTCKAGNVTSYFSREQDWKSAAGPGRCANCSQKSRYSKRRKNRLQKFCKSVRSSRIAPRATFSRVRLRKKLREPEELKDPQVVEQLCRLTMLVNWFVDDYVENARSFVREVEKEHQDIYHGKKMERKEETRGRGEDEEEKEKAHLKGSQYVRNMNLPETLNQVEEWRIQRSFLHFEFHRRLFGGLDRYEWHVSETYATYRRLHDFSFGRFENPELSSVYEFMIARMTRICKGIDRSSTSRPKMVLELRNDNGIDSPNVPMAFSNNFKGSSELPRFIPNQIDEEEYPQYRRKTHAFLVELGLPFCKRFFHMNAKRQNEIIQEYSSSWCYKLLAIATECALYHRPPETIDLLNSNPSKCEIGEVTSFRGYELLEENRGKLPRKGNCEYHSNYIIDDTTDSDPEDDEATMQRDEVAIQSRRRNEFDRFIEEMDY